MNAPPTGGPEGLCWVGLRLRDRRVVVVGGGQRAHRAVAAVLDAGAAVCVISPALTPALEALAARGSVTWMRRRYQPGDLVGAWYAVAATGEPAVNTAIAEEAERARVFCAGPGELPLDSGTIPRHQRGVGAQGRGEVRRGGVVLVGGAGHPGLITVRGMQALSRQRRADPFGRPASDLRFTVGLTGFEPATP